MDNRVGCLCFIREKEHFLIYLVSSVRPSVCLSVEYVRGSQVSLLKVTKARSRWSEIPSFFLSVVVCLNNVSLKE